jgi:tRNA dimethylallyltransferase
MYFHWLIYKPDFMPEDTGEVRASLEKEDTLVLYDRLRAINPETKIQANDRKRIVRALEVFALTGKLPKDSAKERERDTEFDFRLFTLMPDRQWLYERINRRVDVMLENGMLDEVRRVYDMGINEEHQAYKAIGCRQFIDYFEKRCSLDEATEKVRQESRRYAKRQLTWMRGEDAIQLTGSPSENIDEILRGM